MKDIRDWVDVAFKVVLAVVGIIVGYYFSFQKQQNEDIKLIVDMTTSTETSKRILGAAITEAYLNQGRIPQAVYVAVFSYANNSDDQKLRTVVNAGASASSTNDENLQKALTQASNSLPIRVFFHIAREEDRGAASAIERNIEGAQTAEGNPIIVPGIEYVRTAVPSKSILKCFRKAECDALGPELLNIFKQNNVTIELSNQSAKYENSTAIRPNHFEAWFAPLSGG